MYTQFGLLECVKKFARKFAAKGYFDDFQLFLSNAKTPETSGDLKYCLEEFIKDFQAGYKMTVPFILCTTADYKHDIGNINCRFEVTFDHLKGFTANSLEIEDARSGQKRFYHVDNFRQIPPATRLKALLLRPLQPPKRWKFWKKKFRP